MGCRPGINLSRIFPPPALNFMITLRLLSTHLIISISNSSGIRKMREPNAMSAVFTSSTQQQRYAIISCARGMHPEDSSTTKKSSGIIRRELRGTTARNAWIRILQTARIAGVRRLHTPLLARSISQGNDISLHVIIKILLNF
jgi:hypothetical protein